MNLYLQFGYGMMAHVKHMFKQWDGGTVILSPRDMNEDQMSRLAEEMIAIKGKTLFDAQLYVPRSNHHGLLKHEYYKEFGGDNYTTNMCADTNRMNDLFVKLKRLNDLANTDKYIIPSLYCDEADDSWAMLQKSFLRASEKIFNDKKRLMTICVSSKILSNPKKDKVEQLLGQVKNWDIDGFYILPEGDYLDNNSIWFANLLSLVAGLKLLKKEVVVGYSNHQMLALACTGVNAIATGNWLNVRHFNLKRFEEPKSTGGKKVAWYYCPSTQSEYKFATLEAARRLGNIDINIFKTDISMNSSYVNSYFSDEVEFKEQATFRHYFQCLHKQSEIISKGTYESTYSAVCNIQENAEDMIKKLSDKSFKERDRSYSSVGDSTLSALEIFNKEKGLLMKRSWASFS